MNTQTIKKNIAIYLIVIIALIGSIFDALTQSNKVNISQKVEVKYTQPRLPISNGAWSIQSIDTQVISKHWPNVSRSAVQEQVKLLKDIGANYIAIGTPYDKVDDIRMWTEEIHAAGLNVWFRSHWAEWEGDEGKSATMLPDEYLDLTEKFILANPDLFLPGDAFTVAVEAENVGVGLGKRFLTWDSYRSFTLNQILVANNAFTKIGLGNRIHTNWISVNGWIVDNQITPDLAKHLGLITVDHYVGQSNTIGQYGDPYEIVNMTVKDLTRYNQKLGVPILLGEWGYQIFQPVPDENQAQVIEMMFKELSKLDFLVGINYWVHMGNTASIIGDSFGSNLRYRTSAEVINSYFSSKTLPKISP